MMFPKNSYDTAGYVIGKTNGDHWCLYLATPLAYDSDGNIFLPRQVGEVAQQVKDDVTIEILMHDLDPQAMKAFWRTEEEAKQALLPGNVNARKHKLFNPRRLYVFSN
jgi:S-adenosylmethionine decarboxylase